MSDFDPPTSTLQNDVASGSQQEQQASELMSQIWDVVESPMFAAALLEVTDSCYRLVMDQLRRNVYNTAMQQPHQAINNHNNSSESSVHSAAGSIGSNGNHSVHSNTVRCPPLASLLPQIKAISTSLLPGDPRGSVDVARDLLGGPLLEALCTAVVDADFEDYADGAEGLLGADGDVDEDDEDDDDEWYAAAGRTEDVEPTI